MWNVLSGGCVCHKLALGFLAALYAIALRQCLAASLPCSLSSPRLLCVLQDVHPGLYIGFLYAKASSTGLPFTFSLFLACALLCCTIIARHGSGFACDWCDLCAVVSAIARFVCESCVIRCLREFHNVLQGCLF